MPLTRSLATAGGGAAGNPPGGGGGGGGPPPPKPGIGGGGGGGGGGIAACQGHVRRAAVLRDVYGSSKVTISCRLCSCVELLHCVE